MNMKVYTIDTNAGPILRHKATSPDKVKQYMERMIPLLSRRGYTSSWSRSGVWYVITVLNSKGKQVHAAAFREGNFR